MFTFFLYISELMNLRMRWLEMGANVDVRKMSEGGGFIVFFLLASHDGILPWGSLLLLHLFRTPLCFPSPLPPSVLASLPRWLSTWHLDHNWS